MGDLFAPSHLIIVLLIVILLFGSKKIPDIAKGIGEGIKEFKKATSRRSLKKKFKILLILLRNLIRKRKKPKKDGESLTFLDHLEELRGRLHGHTISGRVSRQYPLFYLLEKKYFDVVLGYPLRYVNPKPHIIFTAPTEAVMLSLLIAIATGVVVASPILFLPGLAFRISGTL